ncbi:hypothetical protein [Enterobacter kobei]|uniref:hypothetical protein n=1 Tax=Enterobacter kobei TaxID=208224 RepID=UPI0039C99675
MTLEERVAALEKELLEIKKNGRNQTAELALVISKAAEDGAVTAIEKIKQDFIFRGPLRRLLE